MYMHINERDARAVFGSIDSNGVGAITMGDFCTWIELERFGKSLADELNKESERYYRKRVSSPTKRPAFVVKKSR
jgi:hypothetical protein